MDDDGTGYIERSDLRIATERLGAEYGHLPAPPALARLMELTTAFWEHLARVADTDGDGRISEAEYGGGASRRRSGRSSGATRG